MIKAINQKGFNLFTALISFLLIMLAVLLIQSMIQTERNAADTIANIESRTRLEATAEMARADSMQVFNYALRKKIEDWLTDPNRGGLTLQLQDRTWEEIQQEFAESKFGKTQADGSQFAKFTASSLEGIFYSPSHFGNYTISLEGSATLETSIQKAIAKSMDDFFTVIDCPDGDPKNCPRGTFYVNLHIERLTQEEYEGLPKLHVVDRATGEELKEIILPRTTFRIYVPLRFFKAIAEARALAHYPEGGGSFASPSWVDTTSDNGLFSPKNHNEIEQLALGVCDFGSCAPRTTPLQVQSQTKINGLNMFCPGDSGSPSWSQGMATSLQCGETWCGNYNVPTQYNANSDDEWKNMKDALGLVAKARVCQILKDARASGFIDADPDDEFTLLGNECEGQGVQLAYDISINVDNRTSKIIGQGSATTQSANLGRFLGLYTGSGGEIEYPDTQGTQFLDCSGLTTEQKSKCSEVKSVKVTLAFREENPNYMVTETKPGEERIYRISIYDNTYVPFTANWTQGTSPRDLYSGPPSKTNCSFASGQGWHCQTILQNPTMDSPLTKAIGCMPN